MSILLSGIGSAFLLALSLQVFPAVAGEMHGMTSNNATVEKYLVDDLKPLVREKSGKDNSEVQVARVMAGSGP